MFNIINNKRIFLAIVAICYLTTSCKKLIEVDAPTNKTTETNVYNSDLTATAVLTGLYSDLSNRGRAASSPNFITFSKLGGLSSDEFNLWSGASEREKAYYRNELRTITGGVSGGVNAGMEMWNVCYGYIFTCNQAIWGISNSSGMTEPVKKQLLGEARFMRSLFYFYLVNLYGDVPLVTGTDPEINRQLNRNSSLEVYNQIISDLKEAQSLLKDVFVNSALQPSSDAERVRPTRWAASALLARVFLYTGRYMEAEAEATEVINQTNLFNVSTTGLTEVFLKNSKEAIWQLQPVIVGWNTINARWFNLSLTPSGFSQDKSVSLSTSLVNAFEAGDDRRENWVGTYSNSSGTFQFAAKYKAGSNAAITATNQGAMTEYCMVLRLAEQYLIRAEARAYQNNIAGAVDDLNVLRTRARATPTIAIPNPLPNLSTSLTQTQVIDAIMQERRVELFAEWGHRWLDLKRTGKVDAVMNIITPLKGGTWQKTDELYPLPIEDIISNHNLVQNAGY